MDDPFDLSYNHCRSFNYTSFKGEVMSDLRDLFKSKEGWRINPKLSGDPNYADYVQRMAKAQREANPELYNRPKPVKPEGMTKEEWIFSLQAKSTQEIIMKQKDPDYRRDWSSPFEIDPTVRKEDGSIDTGERSVSIDEFQSFKSMQRASKNSLGQSEESSVTKESRDRGAHHFVVSPPAKITEAEKDKVTTLTAPIKGVPASLPEYEWKNLSVIGAAWHWLKGGKVKSVKKNE